MRVLLVLLVASLALVLVQGEPWDDDSDGGLVGQGDTLDSWPEDSGLLMLRRGRKGKKGRRLGYVRILFSTFSPLNSL